MSKCQIDGREDRVQTVKDIAVICYEAGQSGILLGRKPMAVCGLAVESSFKGRKQPIPPPNLFAGPTVL